MRSRLLVRLDAAIARTRDPVQLACLRAERAGFLGRHGQVELARGQVHEIQRQFARQPHVAVSGWLALAEGQIEQYANLGSALACDRLKRAHALSAAAGMVPLQALSAAWLSHAHYLADECARMAACCAEALRLAAPDHHASRWRACLSAAVTFHYAGRLDMALPWYAAARQHALADGDEVALSAVLYNQAGLRADQARHLAAFGGAAGGAAAMHAAMGMDSVGHFDAGNGIQSMDWLVPIMRAQLLVLEDRFEDALMLMDRHVERTPAGWHARMQAGLLADRAWCLLHLGCEAEARDVLQRAARAACSDASDMDDRALAHARLAQLYRHFGDPQRAAEHQARALLDRERYLVQQERTLSIVEPVLKELTPQ